MLVGALFILTLFAAQLLRIQGMDANALASQALSSRSTTVPLVAHRGQILDASGKPLATTVDRRNIIVNQTQVGCYTPASTSATYKCLNQPGKVKGTAAGVSAAAATLSPILDLPKATLVHALTGSRGFAYVTKGVTPLVWTHVSQLGIPGLSSEATTQRVYPQGPLAAALVGFVGASGQPLGGLELGLNSTLTGKPGKVTYEKAPGGAVISTAPLEQVNPVPGQDVRLTINQDLQWKAETLIAQQVAATKALSGTIVVMDAKTGDLLALAAAPTFDPTNVGKATNSELVDQALAGVYEPGSVSKVMTASAALEEGVVTPTTPVTVPGTLHRSDRIFHDAEAHGTERLTFAGVLAKSSNIGTIKVGEKMSPQTMWTYLTKFGIGQPTGLKFPGESPGILANYQDWSGSQRYTVLFGQGLSLNSVQAAGVFQTIANNGVRMPPRLVDGYVGADGQETTAPASKGIQVVSPEVAKQVRTMLEGVVSSEGTAPAARIPGYRVAGKTGTAQRYDPNCHCYRGYTASFIGMAPADNPQLVVAVALQRPIKGHFGGTVAAPLFKQMMSYALTARDVPPSGSKSPTVRIYPKGSKR